MSYLTHEARELIATCSCCGEPVLPGDICWCSREQETLSEEEIQALLADYPSVEE